MPQTVTTYPDHDKATSKSRPLLDTLHVMTAEVIPDQPFVVSSPEAPPAVPASARLLEPPYTCLDLTTHEPDSYFFLLAEATATPNNWPPSLQEVPPHLSRTFTEEQWLELWSRLDPVITSFNRHRKICKGCSMTAFWGWSIANSVVVVYASTTVVVASFVAAVLMIGSALIWIQRQRKGARQSFQSTCTDATDTLRERGAGTVTVACDYERDQFGSKQGFCLYFIPVEANQNHWERMEQEPLSRNAMSLRHGQLYIPIGHANLCTWSSIFFESPASLPAEFNQVEPDLWTRFWYDWQALSKRYHLFPRVKILVSLASVFILVALMVQWFWVALMGFLSTIVLMCVWYMYSKFRLPIQRMMLVRQYWIEFGCGGTFLQYRAIARESGFGLEFVEYLVLARLPPWLDSADARPIPQRTVAGTGSSWNMYLLYGTMLLYAVTQHLS